MSVILNCLFSLSLSRLVRIVVPTVVGIFSAAILSAEAPLARDGDEAEALAESARLRDAGQWEAASRTLQVHLAAHPPCMPARRMLAQILYWQRDVGGARRTYEAALALDPADVPVRLEYARMLVDTNDAPRARSLLEVLTSHPSRSADAETLLGTLSYFGGDLSRAETHFRRALQIDPEHSEALRRLHEVRTVSAPWIRLRSSYFRDDQPLQGAEALLEGGFRLGARSLANLRLRPRTFSSGALETTLVGAEADLSRTFARSGITTEAGAGVLLRDDSSTDWTGRLGAQRRLGAGMTLGLAAERAPYLSTPSSLRQSILTLTVKGTLGFSSRSGWLGQASYAQQRFPDDNAIESTYAWLVAPVLRGNPPRLGLGYGFSWQDSRSSRFVPMGGTSVGPVVPGGYDPYYTPARARSHQVVATTSFKHRTGLTLSASGSWAFWAREEVPLLLSDPGGTVSGGADEFARVFFTRPFRPWSARGSVSRAFADFTISVHAEHLVTSQYASTSASLEIGYRFTGVPSRGR